MAKISLQSTKFVNIFLSFLLFAIIIFIFFSQRQIFFYKYEPEYYENWYYHSQWNYPDSSRGISDGELYKFVGYRLIEGENPFNINFEMPPFGKSLYGLAEKYLGNPYWISILCYFFSLFIFYLLSKEIFGNKQLVWLSLFLFASSPFVANQIGQTMLDLPLMTLYLAHIYFFIRFLSNKKLKIMAISGIFLGLATGTKPGIYTPLVLVLDFFLIFLTTRKVLDLVFYLGLIFAGYILAYFTYFIRHPNPFPWLKLHQKSLNFYLQPDINIDYFKQWRLIFFNYQEWWQSGKRIALGDGTLILPLGLIALFVVFFSGLKNKDRRWICIGGILLIFLIVNTFIPFSPRYLMPAIPLFVLSIIFLFGRVKWFIFLLCLINLPFLAYSLSSNDPSGDIQATARFISTRAYRELYRSILPSQRKNLSEGIFIENWENFLEKIGTREIEVKTEKITKSKDHTSVKFKIKYITRYGELIHEPEIDYFKSHNQWKILWRWDYLLSEYTPESKIVIYEKTIPFLRLVDKNGGVLAERGEGKEVYIIPRVMFDWNQSLAMLSKITGESTEVIDKKIRKVIPDQYPRFVGYLDLGLGEEEKRKASSLPGVILKSTIYAVIVNKKISPREIGEKIRLIQIQNPELFYIQSEAYIENDKSKKIVIPFSRVNQNEIIIQL